MAATITIYFSKPTGDGVGRARWINLLAWAQNDPEGYAILREGLWFDGKKWNSDKETMRKVGLYKGE
jgi:hypothetical protein